MRIAVTGGAGYIGSHTCVELLGVGHEVLILDSFLNAERDVPEQIAAIAGRTVEVAEVDLDDRAGLARSLSDFGPDAVVHFAGLKAVGEAMEKPLDYYRVNVSGSLNLLDEMTRIGCERLVFSSSATVYGRPEQVPIPENHPLSPTNPYGQTKLMVERIIEDLGQARPTFSAVSLRYFNPVGAHPSGQIGEAPRGVPNNLMPFIADVAAGARSELKVYGDDWDTPDGTGVRDYIHVMDLAAAHLAAIEMTGDNPGVRAINVGSGRGYSVMEMIRAFEAASGQPVPYVMSDRRPGDVASSVADPALAESRLKWRATRDLAAMCADVWRWRSGRSA